METKFIKLADMRKLNKQVSLGDISSSRMIEIINEKANEYTKMHIENFKIEQAKKLLEVFGKWADEHIEKIQCDKMVFVLKEHD